MLGCQGSGKTQLLKHYVSTKLVDLCKAGLVLFVDAAAQRGGCGKAALVNYQSNARPR